MKNKTTNLAKTTNKLSTLIRPLHVTVNPEFADAAKEAAQQTKDTAVQVAQKTSLLAKLVGRKAGAAIQALKETK